MDISNIIEDDVTLYDSDSNSTELSSSSDENVEQTENLQLEGKILRHYNIIYELGRGACSIVWLAFNIQNKKFYAIKVQDPNEFKQGLNEIKFVQKLPKDPPIFNNIIEYFIENINYKKYLCSVWKLHLSNIDFLIRKCNYNNGFNIDQVKSIMKQLIKAIKILHNKFRVFHGDIKTDNILIQGNTIKNNNIIKYYLEEYNNNNNLDRIDYHKNLTENVLNIYNNFDKYDIDNKYVDNICVRLADFGTYCDEHDHYETSFGTRYYQAPEIILMGKCSYPVDIWALGCTFYELLSGQLLFDPIKDSVHNRDWHHLSLIIDTCGNFTSKILKKTKHYSIYFDSNNKLYDYIPAEESRLDRKINEINNISDDDKKNIKEILKLMLDIDSSKRININELSKHTFFT